MKYIFSSKILGLRDNYGKYYRTIHKVMKYNMRHGRTDLQADISDCCQRHIEEKSFLCCHGYACNLPLVSPQMLIKYKGSTVAVRALMRQRFECGTKLSVLSLPSLIICCVVCG